MIHTLKVNIDVPSNTRGESVFKFGAAGYYLGIFCGEVLGFLFFFISLGGLSVPLSLSKSIILIV